MGDYISDTKIKLYDIIKSTHKKLSNGQDMTTEEFQNIFQFSQSLLNQLYPVPRELLHTNKNFQRYKKAIIGLLDYDTPNGHVNKKSYMFSSAQKSMSKHIQNIEINDPIISEYLKIKNSN